ncbi:MAG: alpha/beta hydrolase [Deltaproteobacteria bacterium]|nr:alpha/beta hydrolase [Deltaproteobacteria bacterium]MBW2395290.1 alpha/beta hydrolase [Deltaproteobacteria bacterium]
MYIQVNGVRLFFDVEGEKFVADGAEMREKPTLILLHGGPGFDHSMWKPEFGQLRDQVQIVYLDHRGNGRSEHGPTEHWHLDQWADDVRGLCDALGIERPIVMGQSFGGMVAIAYAARHPEHPSKLIFSSTSARMTLPRMLERFLEVGGEAARDAAERFWTQPGLETLPEYTRNAVSVYGSKPASPDEFARVRMNLDVLFHFAGGESSTFDYLDPLERVQCPTLVLGGTRDPVCPIEDQDDIAAALPEKWVQYEKFEGCGHGVFRDDPERGMAVIRAFLEA